MLEQNSPSAFWGVVVVSGPVAGLQTSLLTTHEMLANGAHQPQKILDGDKVGEARPWQCAHTGMPHGIVSSASPLAQE